jgi:hypothetical protein
MTADQVGIEQEIDTIRRFTPVMTEGRLVIGISPFVNAEWSDTVDGSLVSLGSPLRSPLRVGSGVEVATTVKPDTIGAAEGQGFQPFDTAIHQRNHCPVGPPVAVTFSRFVTGEGEGITSFNQYDVTPTVNNG